MSKSTRWAVCLLVTSAIAVPASVWAQAVPRGSGGSSEPSSGSSSSGSSSSGSSSSGSSSPSSGGSSSSSTPAYEPPPPPPSRTPPPPRPAPDSSRTGTAVPRNSGASSGSTSSSNGTASRVSGGGDSSSSTSGSGVNNATINNDPRSRNRGERVAAGLAVPRDSASVPVVGGFGQWYPWYSSGLNWNYGYYDYNPYAYGYTRWTWGRYGMWYDPYNPYGFYDDPMAYGAPSGYSSNSSYSSSIGSQAPELTGSLRLRVNPSHAKVYIDGTLVGTVNDFNGLGSHLAATAGTHQIEFRADGYETLTITVKVAADKTLTERATLKKK